MTSHFFGGSPRSHHGAVVRAIRYQQPYLSRDPESAQILGDLIGSLGEDVKIRPPLRADYGRQNQHYHGRKQCLARRWCHRPSRGGDRGQYGDWRKGMVTGNIPANSVTVGNPARVIWGL